MSFCEVIGCNPGFDRNRMFHKFPSDDARCKDWLKRIGKTSKNLRPKSAICSRHFRFKDYYTGGKRLLPDAIPMLRLDTINEKSATSKVIKSKQNRQQNKGNTNALKKSVTNARANKLKDIKKSPKIFKNSPKLSTLSATLNRKALARKVSHNSRNEKQARDVSSKLKLHQIRIKHNENNKISTKFISKLHNRTAANLSKTSPRLNRHRVQNIKQDSTLKTRSRSLTLNKQNAGSTGFEQIGKFSNKITIPKSKTQSIHPKSKNSVNTEKVISKTSCNFTKEIETRSSEHLKIQNHRSSVPQETQTRSRRIIRKRKRLLSDSDSEHNDNKANKILRTDVNQRKCHKLGLNSSKSNDAKKNLGISNKGPTQCQSDMCKSSKNLSGIEKMISEMQNKIQMLEKKAILDEMKIESFRKALISRRNTDLHILMDEMDAELLLRIELLYLEYNPQKICRLCLQLIKKEEDLIPLFGQVTNKAVIRLIKKTTNVEVAEEVGMPSRICCDCLEDVKRVDWLQRRTQKSNSLINKFLVLKQNSTRNITELQLASEVRQKVANKFETPAVSLSAAPTNVEETSTYESGRDEFKIEEVFSLDTTPISFEDFTIKQEVDLDNEIGLNHDLNTTYSITTKKSLKSIRCRRCFRVFKNPHSLSLHARYCCKRFQCSECNKYFLNFALFRKHKLRRFACYCAGNLRYCPNCNISFRWKWQLVFHILRHSTQVCMLCDDVVHSKEHLQLHLIEAHKAY